MGRDSQRPTALDLFAGTGGLTLGLEQAGFDVVAAVEHDPIHAAAYRRNFPDTPVICAPVQSLTADDLRSRVGTPDVVFAGLPSHGFSVGGRREPNDPTNGLLLDFARLVRGVASKYFVLETVPGILRRANAWALHRLRLDLEQAGWRIDRPWILDAADFGVPQTRARVYLIGWRKDLDRPEMPPPSVRPVYKRPVGFMRVPRDGLPLGPTVSDAIGDLPEVSRFPRLTETDRVLLDEATVEECLASASVYARRLRGLDRIPADRSSPRPVNQRLLTASGMTRHGSAAVWRFGGTAPGTKEPVSRYYRLHPDGLSCTLRAGSGSDRGSFTSPRPLHPHSPRVITVREGARLHGLPDWFGFNTTKWHGFRQLGSATPPALARAVAERLVEALAVNVAPRAATARIGDDTLLSMDFRDAAAVFGLGMSRAARVRTPRPNDHRGEPESNWEALRLAL